MTEQDPTKEDMSELDYLDDDTQSIEHSGGSVVSDIAPPIDTSDGSALLTADAQYRLHKPALGKGGMGVAFKADKLHRLHSRIVRDMLVSRYMEVGTDRDSEAYRKIRSVLGEEISNLTPEQIERLPLQHLDRIPAENLSYILDRNIHVPPRTIVLKIPLLDRFEDPDKGLEQLVQEAGNVIALNKENIVSTLGVASFNARNFGIDSGRAMVPAIEQEYMDGGDLKNLMQLHEELGFDFPTPVIAYIMYNTARACHQSEGLVHRDISPENIMFMKDGRLKLGDFGTAVVEGLADYYDFAGKIKYASPQQLGYPLRLDDMFKPGNSGYDEEKRRLKSLIDVRSDLYTIGLMGYILAVGKNPFDRKHRGSTNIIQQIRDGFELRKKLTDRIHPAREGDEKTDEYRISRVIERAMRFDEDARYEDAEHMLSLLRDTVLHDVIYGQFSPEGFRTYRQMLDECFSKSVERYESEGEKYVRGRASLAPYARSIAESGIFDSKLRQEHLRILFQSGGNLKKHPFTFREEKYD